MHVAKVLSSGYIFITLTANYAEKEEACGPPRRRRRSGMSERGFPKKKIAANDVQSAATGVITIQKRYRAVLLIILTD